MKIDFEGLEMSQAHILLSKGFSPRIVTLVSTVGDEGMLNVAPFASTGILSYNPSIIYIGISSRNGYKKDTLQNIEFSGEFVINICDEDLAEAMNKTAVDYPPHVNEFEVSGLTPIESEKVKAPRVKESPVSFEIKVIYMLQFGKITNLRHVVVGEVLFIHMRDELYVNNNIDVRKKKTIAHCGNEIYCRTNDLFELERLQI